MHHAVALDGGDRGADRRFGAWQAGGARAQLAQHSTRHRGGTGHRHSGHHPRPDVPGFNGSEVMSVAVDFKNVDIIFGRDTREAIAMLDAGKSRSEILEKTGAVLGCAGASLTVNEGEISVLMGLSGSGKS